MMDSLLDAVGPTVRHRVAFAALVVSLAPCHSGEIQYDRAALWNLEGNGATTASLQQGGLQSGLWTSAARGSTAAAANALHAAAETMPAETAKQLTVPQLFSKMRKKAQQRRMRQPAARADSPLLLALRRMAAAPPEAAVPQPASRNAGLGRHATPGSLDAGRSLPLKANAMALALRAADSDGRQAASRATELDRRHTQAGSLTAGAPSLPPTNALALALRRLAKGGAQASQREQQEAPLGAVASLHAVPGGAGRIGAQPQKLRKVHEVEDAAPQAQPTSEEWPAVVAPLAEGAPPKPEYHGHGGRHTRQPRHDGSSPRKTAGNPANFLSPKNKPAARQLRGGEGSNPPAESSRQAKAAQQPGAQGKLHFLFMLTDDIMHPSIWRHFFVGAQPGTYSLWAHCAQHCNISRMVHHLPQLQVVPSVQSHYCTDLVTPMAQLAKYALQASPDNPGVVQKFIFISDSTLPVKPFAHILRNLTASGNSDLCVMSPSSWASLDVKGQKLYVVKHSQWAVLNRKHAVKLADEWVPPTLGPPGTGSRWNVPVTAAGVGVNQLSRTMFTFNERKKKSGCADEEAIYAMLFGAFAPSGEDEKYIPGLGRLSEKHVDRQGRCLTLVAWEPTQNTVMSAIAGDPSSTVFKNQTKHNAHPLRIEALSARAMTALRTSPYLFARKFSLSGNWDLYSKIAFSEDSDEVLARRSLASFTAMKTLGYWCKNKEGVIGQERGHTLRSCQWSCGDHQNCRFVAFDHAAGSCTRWSSCGAPYNKKGNITLFMKGREAVYTLQESAMQCGAAGAEGWLATLPNQTVSSCQAACTSWHGCEYAVLEGSRQNPAVGSCSLWSTCSSMSPHGSSSIYARENGLAYPVLERGYWCGTPSSPSKLAAAWDQTLQSCTELCSGDDACSYISYDKKSTWCATWSSCKDSGKRDAGAFNNYASHTKVHTRALSNHSDCVRFCSKFDLRRAGSGCQAVAERDTCLSSYVTYQGDMVPCRWDDSNDEPCSRDHEHHYTCHNPEAMCGNSNF